MSRAPSLTPFADASWQERAACKDKGPRLFFGKEGTRQLDREAQAKAVCAECPVETECLLYALATEQPSRRHGIYGGMNEQERARTYQLMKRGRWKP